MPRSFARTANADTYGDAAWITIGEDTSEFKHVESELSRFPTLRIKFFDLLVPVPDLEGGFINPPNTDHAKQIYDFLIDNRDRNIVVNCAAGISRSGAVAQFCFDFLGHEWPEYPRSLACPNFVLYNMLRDLYINNHEISVED